MLMVKLLSSVLILCMLVRMILWIDEKKKKRREGDGISQTTGNQEMQSDFLEISVTNAGKLAVLADGIGKANTGLLCAKIAVHKIIELYEPYQTLNNPEYYFKQAFYAANSQIQKTIGERRGGASAAIVHMGQSYLHYALVGNIKVVLLRNKELIPLSEGHTMNILAEHAYQKGQLSKEQMLWSLKENQIWNYLGMNGFQEIELCEKPIKLKQEDLVLLVSKGIYEEVSFAEIEKIVTRRGGSLQEKAEEITKKAENGSEEGKENGSIMILKTDGCCHEKI